MSGAATPSPGVFAATESEATAGEIFDPFRQLVELPLKATFHPLGFSLNLATNSAEIFSAAEESLGAYPGVFFERPLEVRIAVDEQDPAPCPATLVMRARGHLLTVISDPGNFAACDLAKGFAFCWVTAATARNTAWFRYWYLDTIIYLILWQLHLARVHASCVALDGRGVLLCGPSGAGKSCLAYACARNGWTLISDEATSILRRSRERVVLGMPNYIRLRETAPEILPELNGRPAAPNPVGKMTIELPTKELPGFSTGFQCRADFVVFLNRHAAGPPRLVPLSRDEARRRLERELPMFEQAVYDEHKAAIRNLLEAGVYELCAYDIDSGVRQLESLLLGRG